MYAWSIITFSTFLTFITITGPVTNALIIPTPPDLQNNHTKPTLPIQNFKRHLHVPGQREGAQSSRHHMTNGGSNQRECVAVRLTASDRSEQTKVILQGFTYSQSTRSGQLGGQLAGNWLGNLQATGWGFWHVHFLVVFCCYSLFFLILFACTGMHTWWTSCYDPSMFIMLNSSDGGLETWFYGSRSHLVSQRSRLGLEVQRSRLGLEVQRSRSCSRLLYRRDHKTWREFLFK